jgi:hypothetical protein
MAFYVAARERNPNLAIRVHPLLLSLTETLNTSETIIDIGKISESDERALRSNFYTSPSTLPPLEIHFSGQNGPYHLFGQNGYALILVAGCRECMESTPQDNSAPKSRAMEDDLASMGSISPSTCNKGRKRRRTSSGGVQGNLPNTRHPKAAGTMRRAKGKQAQKAGSWHANPSPPGGKSDESSQEGRDREEKPSMFAGVPVQHFADGIHGSPKAQMMK